MGLDFLKNYQGQSMRATPPQPLPETPEAGEARPVVHLGLEYPPAEWKPLPTQATPGCQTELPRRFIDGCHLGETVSWLRDAAGHPIPVLLAEVGSVAVGMEYGHLKREFGIVQRTLAMITEPFPWHDVEDFARDLHTRLDYRLIEAGQPDEGIGFDFERLRRHTHARSLYEMSVLEQLALMQRLDVPTLVDGPLEIRLRGHGAAPVIAVIKQHRETYVDEHGANVLLNLEPGQRTPAFQIDTENLPVVSWYLKLDGANGCLPNWGVVRAEISVERFRHLADPFGCINGLSHYLMQLRCRQAGYRRAPVSLEPIVWAEKSLRSLFSPMELLTSQFYHATGL